MKQRCKECTLLRVDREGDTCEECVANGAVADFSLPGSAAFTLDFTSSAQKPGTPNNGWYDAVHGLYP